ncbi:MAG: 30S ribosomal protein S16 [Candidatus Kaelpia aquatica]|nr:30S ribosomal protein S16 [Candidatus Kaelpia aquatica]
MAVKIRLRRIGKKKVPHYRIVVADSRAARDGKFIEQIGCYDPKKEADQAKIDKEKAMDWIKKGAQVSETVKSLMKKNGIDPDEFKKAIKKKK